MGVFRKIGNAMARFMYGRNGMDQLNMALLKGYMAISVAQLIFTMLKLEIPVKVCEILLWPVMLVIFFRMFSKNLYTRREENTKFLNWRWRMKNKSQGAKARHDDKDHKYFTCKQCKTICRVPVGKGKIIITCKCGAKMQVKT